jgi:3-oxoacyl-[acyl-carrier protein] reductase
MYTGLKNRIILVTGSSRGIGKEIAITLGKAGAKVAICARDEQELKQASKEFKLHKAVCLPILIDLTKSNSAKYVMERIVRKWGGLDILVNNVGGLLKSGQFEELSDRDWISSFQLNLMPTVRFCREAIPFLKKSSNARILNISSMTASQPGSYNPHYSTLKAAVLNLTKHLAGVYAKDGILVNSISPGIIHTEGWENYIQTKAKSERISLDKCRDIENRRATESVPLKRLGTVKEVADLVAFLASDQATFITGTNHRIDGGRVLAV